MSGPETLEAIKVICETLGGMFACGVVGFLFYHLFR